MKQDLLENEHTLESPELIGTDEEKINGIRFWADLVGMIRSIDHTFISHENKLAILAFLKKEVDLVDIEINNISSQVVSKPGEIPSTEQLPPGEEPPETNIVDLTKAAEVVAAINPGDGEGSVNATTSTPITKTAPPLNKAPTFSDLDKLRRVAGTGNYDKNYVVPESKKPEGEAKKGSFLSFGDLDKLRRVAGSGKWDTKGTK